MLNAGSSTLLIEIAAKSLALSLVFAAALLLVRRLSAARRHLVLLLCVLALLALPFATGVLPRWAVPLPASLSHSTTPILQAQPTTGVQVIAPSDTPVAPAMVAVSDRTAPAPVAPAGSTAATGSRAADALALLWLAGMSLTGIRVVRSLSQARAMLRDARRPTPSSLRSALAELSEEAGLWAKPSLVVSRRDDVVPSTYGWLRPKVLVPAGFDRWPQMRQAATLRHELGHIRRWDWLWLMLSNAACCLYWFNPLVWQLSKKMRHEAELACDDWVLRQGLGPSHYATQILEVVRTMRTTNNRMRAVVQMAGESQLEARVKALLTPGRSRAGVASWSLLALASLVGSIAMPIAALKLQDSTNKGVVKKEQPKKVGSSERVIVLEKKGEPTVVVKVRRSGSQGADDKKAAEQSKKHLAQAKSQVKKELEHVKSRINDLKKRRESQAGAKTELKAMQMAQRALERAMSQLDAPGEGVHVYGSDRAFVWGGDFDKDFAKETEKAMRLFSESMPKDGARSFVWKRFDGKDLPEGVKRLQGKDGITRFEWKGLDSKEFEKGLKELKGMKIEVPDVYRATESALKEALQQLQKAQESGKLSKDEFEAAKKGLEKAIQSGKTKAGAIDRQGRSYFWGEGFPRRIVVVPPTAPRVGGSGTVVVPAPPKAPRAIAPKSGTRTSTIDEMIERSEKRMQERERRSEVEVVVEA